MVKMSKNRHSQLVKLLYFSLSAGFALDGGEKKDYNVQYEKLF